MEEEKLRKKDRKRKILMWVRGQIGKAKIQGLKKIQGNFVTLVDDDISKDKIWGKTVLEFEMGS